MNFIVVSRNPRESGSPREVNMLDLIRIIQRNIQSRLPPSLKIIFQTDACMDNIDNIPVYELASAIRERMVRLSLTLSVAESCTGGRVAASLTSISGASEYFQGGLVAYQNRLKEEFLGVAESVICEYDVVSQPVVEQMVKGACAMFHTDCAIASTGYAGDGNGHIPAGTIWLAWGTTSDVHSLCLKHDDGREENTARATRVALSRFLSWLSKMG